jgi:hypothetical protein
MRKKKTPDKKPEDALAPMTPRLMQTIALARLMASEANHTYVGVEHLCLAAQKIAPQLFQPPQPELPPFMDIPDKSGYTIELLNENAADELRLVRDYNDVHGFIALLTTPVRGWLINDQGTQVYVNDVHTVWTIYRREDFTTLIETLTRFRDDVFPPAGRGETADGKEGA